MSRLPSRSVLDSARNDRLIGLWIYGRNRCQTAGANFARTRLGVFLRSTEGFRKSRRWRCDFAQGWQGPFDRERHLQFEVANYRAPFLAATTGFGSGFLSAPDFAGFRIPRPATCRSEIA